MGNCLSKGGLQEPPPRPLAESKATATGLSTSKGPFPTVDASRRTFWRLSHIWWMAITVDAHKAMRNSVLQLVIGATDIRKDSVMPEWTKCFFTPVVIPTSHTIQYLVPIYWHNNWAAKPLLSHRLNLDTRRLQYPRGAAVLPELSKKQTKLEDRNKLRK